MAKIAYPGDLSDGDPITAESINSRIQPLYKTLNATGIAGADGISDDEIEAGSIAASKINGTAMTLDSNQTVTGDKVFSGDVTVGGADKSTVQSVPDLTATPDASSGRVLKIVYSNGDDIERLVNGVEGQIIYLIVDASAGNIVLKHEFTSKVSDGDMSMDLGADITVTGTTPYAIGFIAVDDGGVIVWRQTTVT